MLIPFNLAVIVLTMKYCKNINKINKRFWPKRQKVSLANLFIVSTVQAIAFSTFYIGSHLIILGVNPKTAYARHKREQEEEMLLIANQKIDIDGKLDQLLAGENKEKVEKELGSSVENTFVVSMFKSMGLSDKTLLMIEQDLRVQKVDTKEVH